jgi:pyruvate formate lyase activating enzyme
VKGVLFDIQHYAVHDGPGIRTLVFLKGCRLSCAWCSNPESQRGEPELRQLLARCKACLRCAHACPTDAITTPAGTPQLDREHCESCTSRACVEACPEHALAVSGREWSVDDVVARVAKDVDFYRNSGGGVTVSGGEPFVQAEFLLAALKRCRALGIHTAVETCGHADRHDITTAEPLVDLFLYDLKVADPARHHELTGADNALVLDNLRLLARRDPGKIVIRVPIVPAFTDDRANIEAIARLARELGIARVELCPYHPLGRGKYGELGRPEPIDPPQPMPDALAHIADVFESHGVRCGPA